MRGLLVLFLVSLAGAGAAFTARHKMHQLGRGDDRQNVLADTVTLDRVANAPEDGVGVLSSLPEHRMLVSLPQTLSASSTPMVGDAETVLNFAKMSSNAYITRSMHAWHPLPSYEEELDDFGWQGDGLRGYIFSNPSRSFVVIAFKGTSTIWSGGPSVARDRQQDNLMFSCCCARVDVSWARPVCGCYEGGLRAGSVCSASCLRQSAAGPDTYYRDAMEIYEEARAEYPGARFWFTGHSMGGAMAALLAASIPGTAAVTFEAPGMALFAQRLGVSGGAQQPAQRRIWNFGLSTDPVYMGTCQGVTSPCYIAGYALETRCRLGHDCEYVIPNGRMDLSSHRIDWIIDKVLVSTAPPECKPVPEDCRDCAEWTFTE